MVTALGGCAAAVATEGSEDTQVSAAGAMSVGEAAHV
jgi:hypothetical protein